MDIGQVEKMIGKHGSDRSSLIAILQEVQKQQGYLPRKTLNCLSQKLKLPLSRLYALATFYRSFSLIPTGRYRISVCLGTACHVRGGQAILNQLERLLRVKAGGTTSDRRFTLETVRCVGCCSIGPVVRIGNETFGRVRQDRLGKIVARFQ